MTNNKVPFTKPHQSFSAQLEKLKGRGLVFEDEDAALHYLSNINYYRLGTYWWSFEEDHDTHTFKPGSTFEQVLDLYIFDRELRLLLLDAIERIEVALRTQWAYYLGLEEGGSHAHLNPENFTSLRYFNHDRLKESLIKEAKRNKDRNIQDKLDRYEEEAPAIWISCEAMSFGLLSKAYELMKKNHVKNKIAEHFLLKERTLKSFLHHLVVVRNICAHHSRLWNRDFTVGFTLPTKMDEAYKQSFNRQKPKKIYNTLIMISYILNEIAPNNTWSLRVKQLIEKYPDTPIAHMGFPEDWQEHDVWKTSS